MKARYGLASIIGILAIIVVPLYLLADGHIVYPATDERLANIEGTLGIVYPTATTEATATDVPPTATEVAPTATADPGGENPTAWHAPDGHEHGSAPPAWAEQWSMETFGHGVIYGGDEGTPNENELKHNAYKGQIVPSAAGGEAYVRFHAQSNPHGRAAQFHSYEVYYRDTAGGVSFFQGHLDCGDPNTRRFPRSQGDPGTRPAMLVVDQAAWDAGIRTEQWYCFATGPRLVEIGVNIGNTSTIWHPGEQNNNPHDQSTWDVTGAYGTNRLVDFFIYRHRLGGFVGTICLTAQGQQATCGEPGALPQVVAATIYNDFRTEFGIQRISGLSQVNHSLPNPALPN